MHLRLFESVLMRRGCWLLSTQEQEYLAVPEHLESLSTMVFQWGFVPSVYFHRISVLTKTEQCYDTTKIVQNLSESCKKVSGRLPESCQKVSRTCQEFAIKLSERCQKIFGKFLERCQKVV